MKFATTRVIPVSLTIIGVVLLYVWLSADAAVGLKERLPEKALSESLSEGVSIRELRGELVRYDGKPANIPGAWPQFRGADLDAIYHLEIPLAPQPTGQSEVRLAKSWPEEGPGILWSLDLGEGFAGAAILDGRVYLIDYDQENQADVIRCLSLEDGSDIWSYSYPVKIKRNHGMSRTVPAVTEKYIVTMGPKCHVTCLDSMTGEFRWMKDLVREFGTVVPEWYAGQCPLIEDGKAIIAPGGSALMMSVDCETGEILWQSPNPNKWKMTHSSITPIEFDDTRIYVYCASGGVVGISAQTGEILWEYPEWRIRNANVASPLVIGDGCIFLSGGYNAGSMILQLAQENGRVVARPVFRPQFNIALDFQDDLNNGIASDELRKELKKNDIVLSTKGVTISTEEPDDQWLIVDGLKKYSVRKEKQELIFSTTRLKPDVFGSEQHTPIFYKGHIYGIRPDKQLVCLDLSGEVLWSSSRTNQFGPRGLGPYSIADGLIYVLDDNGTLTLAEATPAGYNQLARAKVLEGPDAWAPMAFASGRLIVRDMNRMVCLDIAEH